LQATKKNPAAINREQVDVNVGLFAGYIGLFCRRCRALLQEIVEIKKIPAVINWDTCEHVNVDVGLFCGICMALLRKIQVLLPVDSEKQNM